MIFDYHCAQKNDKITRMCTICEKSRHSTALLTTTFASKVRSTTRTGMGSAITRMYRGLVARVERRCDASSPDGESSTPTQHGSQQSRRMETVITCNRAVIFDSQLHIRHGSVPVLHETCWLGGSELVGEPLLDLLLLEAHGPHCHKAFSAVADRHGGTVDVSTLVASRVDSISEPVSRILNGESHADGGVKDARLVDKVDGWLDLGTK